MRRAFGQCGFSLVEVLLSIGIIVIMAGVLVGLGGHLKDQANVTLCESQLKVIANALQVYYDEEKAFPVVTKYDGNGDGDYSGEFDYELYGWSQLEGDMTAGGAFESYVGGTLDDEDAPIAAVYYFLSRLPHSRMVVDSLSAQLMTNQNPGTAEGQSGFKGQSMDVSFLLNGQLKDVDLVRPVDPWGKSILYEYYDGMVFPALTSAGPDGDFDTAGDNVTN